MLRPARKPATLRTQHTTAPHHIQVRNTKNRGRATLHTLNRRLHPRTHTHPAGAKRVPAGGARTVTVGTARARCRVRHNPNTSTQPMERPACAGAALAHHSATTTGAGTQAGAVPMVAAAAGAHGLARAPALSRDELEPTYYLTTPTWCKGGCCAHCALTEIAQADPCRRQQRQRRTATWRQAAGP